MHTQNVVIELYHFKYPISSHVNLIVKHRLITHGSEYGGSAVTATPERVKNQSCLRSEFSHTSPWMLFQSFKTSFSHGFKCLSHLQRGLLASRWAMEGGAEWGTGPVHCGALVSSMPVSPPGILVCFSESLLATRGAVFLSAAFWTWLGGW